LNKLGEQLGPLEAAYADVRFLEVDFEQTGKRFDALVMAMDRELAGKEKLEKALSTLHADLASGIAQLKAHVDANRKNTAELCSSRAQLAPLRASVIAFADRVEEINNNGQRQSVDPEAAAVLHAQIDQIDRDILHALEEVDRDRDLEAIGGKVHSIASSAVVLEGDIETMEAELKHYPQGDPRVEKLRLTLNEIKGRRRAELEKLTAESEALGNRLAEIRDSLAMSSKKEVTPVAKAPAGGKKKKKGKKPHKKEELAEAEPTAESAAGSSDDRDQQIAAFSKAIYEVESEVVPSLVRLESHVAGDHRVDATVVAPASETGNQIAEAQKLVLHLKVGLSENLIDDHSLQKDLIKAQLAEKEKERDEVHKIMVEVEFLEKLVAPAAPESTEPQPLERQMVEERVKQVEEQLKKVEEMPISNLTTSETHILDSSRNEARELLVKLKAKCSDLQRQLNDVEAMKSRKVELDKALGSITLHLATLRADFSSPQPLAAAEEKLTEVEALHKRLDEVHEELGELMDNAKNTLPANDQLVEEIQEGEMAAESALSDLLHLIQSLQADTENVRSLLEGRRNCAAEVESLEKQLELTRKDASDPEKEGKTLARIGDGVDQVLYSLNELRVGAEEALPTTVSYSLELDPLFEKAQHLRTAVADDLKKANKELSVRLVEAEMAKEFDRVVAQIVKAEQISADAKATEELLLEIIAELTTAAGASQKVVEVK